MAWWPEVDSKGLSSLIGYLMTSLQRPLLPARPAHPAVLQVKSCPFYLGPWVRSPHCSRVCPAHPFPRALSCLRGISESVLHEGTHWKSAYNQ